MGTRQDRRHITLKATSYFKRLDFSVYPAKIISKIKSDNPSVRERFSKQYFVYDTGTSKITIVLRHNLSTRLTYASISGEVWNAEVGSPHSEKSENDYALRNDKDLEIFSKEIDRYFDLFPERKIVEHWMEGLISWYLPDFRPYKPSPDEEKSGVEDKE